MEEFLAAYKAWWRMPFPDGAEEDDLNDVHGDLHLLFEWVLSTVEPFAENGTIVPVKVDIEAGLGDLRSRLAGRRRELSGGDALRTDQYLAYLDALDLVYANFRRVTATP